MAASLNASLSQEKGIGPALAMSAVLVQVSDGLNEGDIVSLLLPGVIRAQDVDAEKATSLLKVLGQTDARLDQAMVRVLGSDQSPTSLTGLGIPRSALDDAAHAAAGKAGLNFESARSVLDAIYEERIP